MAVDIGVNRETGTSMPTDGARSNPAAPASTGGEPAALAGEPPINRRLLFGQILLLVVAVGASIAAIPFAPLIREFPGPAYLALFLLSIQTGALFMVPGFGWAAIAAYAAAFDHVWIPAVIGTSGQAIGEMLSYLLGATGSPWIRRRRAYLRVEGWIRKWGLLTVFVIAAIPNPLFDIAGAVAGAAGIGWWRFFIASWVGRLIKNVGFAFIGIGAAEFIQFLNR